MGLDTTHDAYHGAYGSFTRFRHALARAAGYEVDEIGSGVRSGRESVLLDWGHTEPRNYYGDWDQIPCNTLGPDPLLLLIIHADDEGYLEPEHCALLADRLEELLPKIDADEDGGGHLGNIRAKTQQFIGGCRAASLAGERLEFR